MLSLHNSGVALAGESEDEKLRHYLADGTEIVFPFIQSSVAAA